ncbi:MAG: alpha/beta fold hydrolase [Acidimicrobiales bacterium]
MPLTEIDGRRLAWRLSGEGPPLLFCNGSGATLEHAGPLLRTLAAGFEVLAYDQRGIGASDPAGSRYAMADLAADALDLLDAVGWRSARVLGISFGGMVAQEIAVTAPGRVERLALLCTSAGGPGGSSYPLDRLVDLAPEERAATMRRLLDTRFDDQWLAGHPADRALADLATVTAPPDPAADEGRRLQLEARRHHDTWDRLGAVRCPTLVACGRYDGIAPPANGEALASRIAGAELRVYEGGHLFVIQDPAAAGEVRSFLAGSP